MVLWKFQCFLVMQNHSIENKQNLSVKLKEHLVENGFKPRTLGITDNSTSAPLMKIREIMNECHGLLSVAFRRGFIEKGVSKPNTNLAGHIQYDISQKWITSPYCQIEPSMAFQIDCLS